MSRLGALQRTSGGLRKPVASVQCRQKGRMFCQSLLLSKDSMQSPLLGHILVSLFGGSLGRALKRAMDNRF